MSCCMLPETDSSEKSSYWEYLMKSKVVVWGAPTAVLTHTQTCQAKAAAKYPWRPDSMCKNHCVHWMYSWPSVYSSWGNWPNSLEQASVLPWAGLPSTPPFHHCSWSPLPWSRGGGCPHGPPYTAAQSRDLPPPPSASLIFANYLSYLCSIPHL